MLESRKYNLIEWIISIADEKVIDSIQSIKDQADSSEATDKVQYAYTTSKYREIVDRKIDLEALKEKQNYKPTSTEEWSAIAKEADIEQSIDFLLEDLKLLG